MRFGMAFEGCACKAAFHVGAVEWLYERGLRPGVVAGASSGAIVAAALALDVVQSLRETWLTATGQRIFRPRRLLRGRWPFAMSDIVGEVVRRHVGETRLPDVTLPLAIPVTLIGRGGMVRRILTRADDLPLADAILASCFLPGPYSRMVPIDGRFAVDGAWAVRTPVDALHELGIAKTIACVSNPEGRLLTGFVRPGVQPIPGDCRVLSPLSALPVGSFDFDPERVRATIEHGRASAAAFCAANEAWLRD